MRKGKRQMKKILIATTLTLVTAVTNAAPITHFELTGGNFGMDGANYFDITPGVYADVTVGGYDGGDPDSVDMGTNSIGYFTLGLFGPVTISTRAADDFNSGFRPVSGDITDGNLTLDLDAWTLWYSGIVFNQGNNDKCVAEKMIWIETCSTPMITTYDASTGAFTAEWNSVVTDGLFRRNLGEWIITGQVSAVPVPAAAWLFSSGLIGLAGIARRKRN